VLLFYDNEAPSAAPSSQQASTSPGVSSPITDTGFCASCQRRPVVIF
jgi:hypothetical protein